MWSREQCKLAEKIATGFVKARVLLHVGIEQVSRAIFALVNCVNIYIYIYLGLVGDFALNGMIQTNWLYVGLLDDMTDMIYLKSFEWFDIWYYLMLFGYDMIAQLSFLLPRFTSILFTSSARGLAFSRRPTKTHASLSRPFWSFQSHRGFVKHQSFRAHLVDRLAMTGPSEQWCNSSGSIELACHSMNRCATFWLRQVSSLPRRSTFLEFHASRISISWIFFSWQTWLTSLMKGLHIVVRI